MILVGYESDIVLDPSCRQTGEAAPRVSSPAPAKEESCKGGPLEDRGHLTSGWKKKSQANTLARLCTMLPRRDFTRVPLFADRCENQILDAFCQSSQRKVSVVMGCQLDEIRCKRNFKKPRVPTRRKPETLPGSAGYSGVLSKPSHTTNLDTAKTNAPGRRCAM
jgi:hypothetical protein